MKQMNPKTKVHSASEQFATVFIDTARAVREFGRALEQLSFLLAEASRVPPLKLTTTADYRRAAQQIREARVDLLRAHAEAGYRPAWSKLVYMGMGMDMSFAQIEEMDRVGEQIEQALRNPYV
jgi:hypothetical protein